MREKIIEIFKKNQKTMAIGMTLFHGIHSNNFEKIADGILALPLYEKEFVEWIVFECDTIKESQYPHESEEEMIERLYFNWKNLKK